MTRHRMRLVERMIQEGSCDFIVEAPTPALAAAILLAAHKRVFKQCSNLVTLPDGLAETQSVCRWSRYIGGMFVVENIGLCRLLDEAGQEIEEVIPEWDGATAGKQQPGAGRHRGAGLVMRQCSAQRQRGGANPLGVGVIAVGSSYYVQDERHFRDRCFPAPICREPWQVEAFINSLMHAARRDRDTGQWEDAYRSGRSDMAVVRSLRNGRRRTVAVHLLVLHDDLGLAKDITAYPTLPDLRLYRCRRPAPALEHAA